MSCHNSIHRKRKINKRKSWNVKLTCSSLRLIDCVFSSLLHNLLTKICQTIYQEMKISLAKPEIFFTIVLPQGDNSKTRHRFVSSADLTINRFFKSGRTGKQLYLWLVPRNMNKPEPASEYINCASYIKFNYSLCHIRLDLKGTCQSLSLFLCSNARVIFLKLLIHVHVPVLKSKYQ